MVTLAYQILVRMYFLPIIKIFMDYQQQMEHHIGLNACSADWDVIGQVVHDPDRRVFDADYSGFDKTIPIDVMHAVCSCCVILMRGCGYTPADIRVAETLFSDMAYARIFIDGLVLIMNRGNPSGNPGTTLFNTLANMILYRCSWYAYQYDVIHGPLKFGPSRSRMPYMELLDFTKYCKLSTYGDDSVCSVLAGCDFNGVIMGKYCALFGMKYTNADKGDTLAAYTDPHKVTFLKRGMVDALLTKPGTRPVYLAPLDKASIFKSLVFSRKSVEHPLFVLSQCLVNACREFFHHGRAEFDKHRRIFNLIIEAHSDDTGCLRHFMPQDGLPTYESLLEERLDGFAYDLI
jgi:hypothetical protein